MLGDQPSLAAAFQSDDRDARPAMSVDNFGESLGIFFVDLLHLVRIIPVKFPCLEKMCAHVCIAPRIAKSSSSSCPFTFSSAELLVPAWRKNSSNVLSFGTGAGQIRVFQQR